MRMRRLPRTGRLTPAGRHRRRLAGAALLATAALLLVGGASGADQPVGSPAGWESLLGDRPSAQLGGRWIVVLAKPSLATRVAAAGGIATEEQERAWTLAAKTDQRDVLARLAFRGVPIEPEHAYYRVFNGFATPLDARALAIVVRDPDVRGVFPVRAAIPAEAAPGSDDDPFGLAGGRRQDVAIPGFTGAGVTVALLDTGVDLVHPFIRSALLRGFDVLDPSGNASAHQNPTSPGRPERHGTEMAGLVAGEGGPGGLEGVAPGVALLPIRIAGWQPDTTGGVSVYGRTDQLLAGMELAVDPNEDGDAHDAARVQLVGVVEPFAAFTDGPLAAAAAGATALDSLVVAPAGNDGPAGPAYGSIGGPGGVPAALTAGAIDTRRRSPTGHVLLLAGLRTLVSGVQPLGGVVAPSLSVSAPVVALPRATQAVVGAAGGFTRLFDSDGYSRVGGAAVLLPRGTSSPEAVREVVAAGARAVLVDGPLPAGSLGTDGPVEVPILGLSATDADAVRLRSARLGSGDARGRRRCVRRERGARRRGAVLVRRTGVRRRPEAGGERCRNRSRDLRPGPRRGRRRALRNAQRLERCRGAHRGGGRAARSGAARPRRSRPEAGSRCHERDAGSAPQGSSTRPQRSRSSSSPIRPQSGSGRRWRRTPRSGDG